MDARDRRMGAWFEAQVVKVTTETSNPNGASENGDSSPQDENIKYHVKYDK